MHKSTGLNSQIDVLSKVTVASCSFYIIYSIVTTAKSRFFLFHTFACFVVQILTSRKK